jgi:tetratricopeptide (TPR) repeat protein
MAAKDKKWILRDSSGHIYGPFTISRLGELISKGIVSGEEDVAAYPSGDWRPLSSENELYEIVLEMLSVAKSSKKNVKLQPTVSKVLLASEKKLNVKVELEAEPMSAKKPLVKATIESRKIVKQELPAAESVAQPVLKTKPLIFEKNLQKKNKFKKENLIPLLFLFFAFILFYVALTSNDKKPRNNKPISLLSPHIKSSGSLEKSQAYVSQAWPYFYSDTVSNYQHAEQLYVKAVEEYPANSDALSMLLMTDKQLWPYAKQDGNDQNALQNILQLLSKADLYGPKRALGSAIVDLTLGRDASAESQVNSSLIAQPNDGRLYDLKAQMYFQNSEYQHAITYYEQAATFLPNWVYPSYMLGFCYGKLGNENAALQYYTRALKINPNHASSRIELGVLEVRYFNREDSGKENILAVLDSGEKLIATAEARGRYALALVYNKQDDRGRAKIEAEKALALNPSDPDVREFLTRIGVAIDSEETTGNDKERMALGDQYMRASNYLGAQAQYKAAFAANPKNARAAIRTAEALWKLHDSTDAIRYLQHAMSADPKFIESYIMFADYKSQRYDFDAASHALDTAVKIDAHNFQIYRGYAELFLRRADANSAEAYANRALQLYETDVKLNEVMSRIQAAKKNIVKGMQYAKRAVELDKTNVQAQVNFGKMKAAFEGVREAAEYMKDLIDTYPNQIALRVGFAEILMIDEQYAESKQVLTQVVTADENNKEAYILLGDINFMNNALDESLGDFLSAARIDPSDPTGLFRAGEVYLKAGKPNEALRQFQLVLRVTPLFPRAHYNLAKAYQGLGLGDLALKELDEEKRLNPKLADPYEYAGDLSMTARNYQMATRNYQKASEIRPQDAGIFIKLARAYKGQGSDDAALAMLNLAKAKESGNALVYRELGLSYVAKGMSSEARAAFQTYLTLDPNATDKAAILDKIRELE